MTHTSHQSAKELRLLADWLESKPAFEDYGFFLRPTHDFWDKEDFLAAVRATKPGKKSERELCGTCYIRFAPTAPVPVVFEISKNRVCRQVRPAQPAYYECEPLLSAAEDAEMEEAV